MEKSRRNRFVLVALIGLFVVVGCKSCVTPQFDFKKTAEPSVFSGPGEVITYSYTVKNQFQNVINFNITDDKLGSVPCNVSQLAIGMEVTCQLPYTTTDEDVAAGVIKNTATATGEFVNNDGVFTFDPTVMTASAEVLYAPQCKLELKKTASPTMYATAGEVISYKYTLKSVGPFELNGPFTLTDDRVDEWACDDGAGTLALCPACAPILCTASYTIKESDVGSNIVNTAHASGVCASTGAPVVSNTDSATVLYLMATPTSQALVPTLTVTETLNQTVYTKAGEVIVYTFKVQNNGTAPVQGPFRVVDSLLDQWECDSTALLPVGGQTKCKGYYLVKDSIVGSDIVNSSRVEAGSASSNVVSGTVYYITTGAPPVPENPARPPILIIPFE